MFRAGREISLAQHVDNIRHVEDCGRLMDGVLAGEEIVLTPSAVGEAPVGVENTGPPTFNFLWHVIGMPAVQIPYGHGPTGLPIGVQLVAHRHADDPLLAVPPHGRTRYCRLKRWLRRLRSIARAVHAVPRPASACPFGRSTRPEPSYSPQSVGRISAA